MYIATIEFECHNCHCHVHSCIHIHLYMISFCSYDFMFPLGRSSVFADQSKQRASPRRTKTVATIQHAAARFCDRGALVDGTIQAFAAAYGTGVREKQEQNIKRCCFFITNFVVWILQRILLHRFQLNLNSSARVIDHVKKKDSQPLP